MTTSDRVRADQIRLVYSLASLGMTAEAAAGIIMTAILANLLPGIVLAGWVLLLLIHLTAVATVVVRFRRANPLVAGMAPWARRIVILSVWSGLIWGGTGLYVALAGDPTDQLLLLFVLGGLIAIGAGSRSASSAALLAFVLPCLVPPVLWALLHGDLYYLTLGGFALIVGTLLVVMGRQSRAYLARLSMAGAENVTLLKHLTEAKDQAERSRHESDNSNQLLHQEISKRREAQTRVEASKKQISSILNNMQDTIFRTDGRGIVTWVSPSVEALVSLRPEQVVGRSLQDLFASAHDYERFRAELDARGGRLSHFVARLGVHEDAAVWTSTNAHYYQGDGGGDAGMEGTIRDISDYKASQDALFLEKGRAQVTLQSIGDGVITTDIDGIIQYMNPAAEKFTGWSQVEAVGEPIAAVLHLVDENTHQTLNEDPVSRCLREGRSVGLSESAVLVHRNEEREFSVEVTSAPIPGSDGLMSGAVLVFHDVTKLRNLARQMSFQARHDPLTGLINRREFETQLANMLKEARDAFKRHSVCYIDLDQFKVVNDTCGHVAGDELLKGVSARLTESLREADTLARLGGDEFGVLLKGCPLDKAKDVAEQMRQAVEHYRFVWDGKELRVGASIGVVPITEDSADLTEVLSAVDSAMYVAKEGGRNRVHVFMPNDTAVAQRHGEMQWKQRIQHALEENRFVLHYQPIIPVHDASDPGLSGEVLLRMVNEKGRLIMPRSFMPAAERYHLMPAIDYWVLNGVFRSIHARSRAGQPARRCAINLSGQSLSDPGFLDFVVDRLTEYDIDPGLLCFEITETAVVANLENVLDFITELRGIGCRFALDDFGSGMSSFSYLKQLPVDFLKIDGGFVVNLASDSKDRSVVKAINEIGHVMGIQTVAEFVEDDRTLATLRGLGVDYAQGYGIGPPVPLDDEQMPEMRIGTR